MGVRRKVMLIVGVSMICSTPYLATMRLEWHGYDCGTALAGKDPVIGNEVAIITRATSRLCPGEVEDQRLEIGVLFAVGAFMVFTAWKPGWLEVPASRSRSLDDRELEHDRV